MQTLKKLLFLFTIKERKHGCLLLLMMVIMAMLDIIGVASVMPFMAVLANPGLIETNFILNNMFEFSGIFGIKNNQEFLFFLGILFFIILIISLTFKALTTFLQIKFFFMLEYSIQKRLIEGYLHQPYEWFLNHHSATLGKSILSESGIVINGGIGPIIELVAKVIVAISFLSLLIFINSTLALIIFFSFGTIYLLIYLFVRSYLKRSGEGRLKANQSRFKSVTEAFGAVKEVKVSGLEEIFIKQFSNSSKAHALHQRNAQVVGQLPRFIIEALAFGGVLLVVLYFMLQEGGLIAALPFIALYIFAGYRLIPALQQIYACLAKLRAVGPALNDLYNDFKNLKQFNPHQDQGILSINKKITLNQICYHYPNTSRMALKDINFNVSAGTTVGLVGVTGSGKTTTVDIILGLLEAQKGSLEVDGQVITKDNCRAWQRCIGYVPQNINLIDDTIAANIAFGVDPKSINQADIERAAKISNLHEFVINELPKQYQTVVGERGVRLSGGQRQRIGIARALYHKPQLLILDEATSSLDNLTEKAVMDAINNLSKDITIILIAHRLSTVKNCDTIFLIDKGQLKNKGTFEELVKYNDQFRNSAKIN